MMLITLCFGNHAYNSIRVVPLLYEVSPIRQKHKKVSSDSIFSFLQ